MATKPTLEVSADVERVEAFLEGRPRATYAEISRHVGRVVNGADRYVLESARRRLERRGIIFAVQRGVGLVRASNGQVAQLSTTQPIGKIARIRRRAKRREQHVDVQQLTADERLAFAVGRVVLHAIGQNTLRSFRSKIAKEIEQRDGELVGVQTLLTLPRFRKEKK